ncbi:MAG: hypothetical protein Kow00117_03140 [Phototrophicales bacterium]
MPEGRELIQIEANEDANSVRDRLAFHRGKRVLLVWPEEGTALTRKLDLVLIQREAMRRAIRLAIVTHDPQVIHHAKELNISTFETIGASERARWKRGRSKVFTSRFDRPGEEIDREALEGIASRTRSRRRMLPPFQVLLIRLGIIAIIALIIGAISYVLVPSATIRLTPARQIIEASVQITVNPDPAFTDIDVENAILPASRIRVEVEQTATIPTTGQQNLGSVQALGEVLFINQTGGTVEIPAGTTVSTSAGTPILFRTTVDATLPGGVGQEVEVPIEAMGASAGEVGNVEANMINTVIGPLEEQVDVININPTRNGESRTVQAVSTADHQVLELQMSQLLQERAYEALQNEIGANQYVILETLQIVEERPEWTIFSAQPGEIADTLTLTKRAIVEAVVVDTQLGQQIVFAQMANQIPRGRSFLPETITYQRGDVSFAGELILFTMSGRGEVIGQIRTEQIQSDIAGMSYDDAMSYLIERVDIAEDTTPEIIISPAWFKEWFNQMPILPNRIQIEEVP